VETRQTAEDVRRLEQLESEERTVSGKRRRLHDRIDFMRASGGISSRAADEQLRRLEAEENQLSLRRRELHVEIDALRVKLGQQPGPRERPRLLGG
jgi:hypothetical protein